MNSFLIGAASSNSGKTTLTMGLLKALRNRGLDIQPYKCGPDYIDPMYHSLASGKESVNLDTWMSGKEQVRTSFDEYGRDADVRVVEGVMGLYDGYDKWHGSSGEIAGILDIPVILVVNAKSTAYSVAPLIHGFKSFKAPDQEKPVRIAGVIFNMVASESHYRFLKEACEDAGVECLGYMAKNTELNIPGRHLGLTIEAREEMEKLICLSSEEALKHIDIDKLLALTKQEDIRRRDNVGKTAHGNERWAVAKDEAFNFIYRANIETLRRRGTVTFFSPLHDKHLPECDHLYLPGGYPELFATELSANDSMRTSIRDYAEQGGHINAECGGFMYLCESIDDDKMCGVLPMKATMNGARLHLGYRTMEKDGKVMRGHEFHYSTIVPTQETPDGITIERCQYSAKGAPVDTAIYKYKNVVAGYTHWLW